MGPSQADWPQTSSETGWDEESVVRPEHFADMVYQTRALSKGGCVSEMLVYELVQDVSGL